MKKQALLESLRVQGFPNFIIKAFEKVKREDFLPDEYKEYAYYDIALPIEERATISQPYTIAFMLNLLELEKLKENKKSSKNIKILEIGSGSGYVLALINEIIKNAEIYGFEINKELAFKSSNLLKDEKNIHIVNRSGFAGYKEKAPFDRILISASSSSFGDIKPLIGQLKDQGILVSPIRTSIFQIKKGKGKAKEFPGFLFVPLVKS